MSASARINTLIGIGTTAGPRVWSGKAQDDAKPPFIVVQTVVETPTNTHDPVATLKQAVVQISCYARTFTAARDLADSVVPLIEGNHADGAIYIDTRREDYDDAADLHRQDIDATVENVGT
jgi:hypothetical protein